MSNTLGFSIDEAFTQEFMYLPSVVNVLLDDVNQSAIITANIVPTVSAPNNKQQKNDSNGEQHSDSFLDNNHLKV